MIANYGYEDGSGFYYITIDGQACSACADHACLGACPQRVYGVEPDDYDDLVAVVVEDARKRLRELCAECKGREGHGEAKLTLPCTSACAAGALEHSW